MPLQLTIVTPEREAVSATCDEVAVPGVDGEAGLLPGHVPVITALRPGVLTVIQEGKKSVYAVSTGCAELEDDQVTVLTAACLAAHEVDVEQAKADVAEMEKKIAELGEQDETYDTLRIRLRRAQARIDAAALAAR